MTFQLVPKEEASGVIAGSDYGARVRIMARSPTHVLFSALGVQVWNRDERGGWHNLTNVTRKRPSKASLAEVAGKLDELFGKGAAEQLIAASGKSLTLLVDGGGKQMPLPRVQQIAKTSAAWSAVTPTWRADLTGRVLRCKQCNENLQPRTDTHHMGYTLQENHPKSVEDCQRLSNHEVVAVFGYDTRYPDRWEYVDWFQTWDGESYMDTDFCNNKCAANYGRRAVRELPLLTPGGEVPETPYRPPEITDHYEVETREVVMPDGRKIRL